MSTDLYRLARLDVNARQWRGSPGWGSGPYGLDLRGMNVNRIQLQSGTDVRGGTITLEKGATTSTWIDLVSYRTQSYLFWLI
jgi:hypothetical protein